MNHVDQQSITIHSRFPLHQREYLREVVITKAEIGDHGWDWLYAGLRRWADESLLKPVSSQDAANLVLGLTFATTVPEWKALTSSPPGQCRADTIVRFFSSFDNALGSRAKLTETRLAHVSMRIRNFLVRYLEAEGAAGVRGQVSRLYRSPHALKSVGRQLISDMPWPGRPPLSATPHDTYADLKEAIRQRLKEDLDLIVAACCDVLDRYEKALQEIEELANAPLSNKRWSEIKNKTTMAVDMYPKSVDWDEQELWDYLRIRANEARAEPRHTPKHTKHGGQAPCKELLKSRLHGISNGAHVHNLLRLAIAPPAIVLLACALIIQRATHWNFMSVLELEASQLNIEKFPHKIQSIKPRTEDETPIVWIERSDTNVIRVFRILREYRQHLIDAKILKNTNQNIWLSSKTAFQGKPSPVVGWGSDLRDFTKKYNFPPFSLEQIRVQCLATISVGVGGVNEVIWAGGHSDSKTSFHYIDRLLLQRLHDASNLEFERRLEATIVYMKDGSHPKRKLLAYPIGDGTSCSAPKAPPRAEWLNAGFCTTEHCSANGGCPNRKIIIDEARIEEVVRLKEFYLINWKRLSKENVVRFEKIHLNQMLFNYALYGVLKRGPYRHLVAKYETKNA